MVKYQGEKVDNIQMHVTNAKNYVVKANDKLAKAKEDHKKVRNRMCCVIVIVLVILLVLVGPMIKSFV